MDQFCKPVIEKDNSEFLKVLDFMNSTIDNVVDKIQFSINLLKLKNDQDIDISPTLNDVESTLIALAPCVINTIHYITNYFYLNSLQKVFLAEINNNKYKLSLEGNFNAAIFYNNLFLTTKDIQYGGKRYRCS